MQNGFLEALEIEEVNVEQLKWTNNDCYDFGLAETSTLGMAIEKVDLYMAKIVLEWTF